VVGRVAALARAAALIAAYDGEHGCCGRKFSEWVPTTDVTVLVALETDSVVRHSKWLMRSATVSGGYGSREETLVDRSTLRRW